MTPTDNKAKYKAEAAPETYIYFNIAKFFLSALQNISMETVS